MAAKFTQLPSACRPVRTEVRAAVEMTYRDAVITDVVMGGHSHAVLAIFDGDAEPELTFFSEPDSEDAAGAMVFKAFEALAGMKSTADITRLVVTTREYRHQIRAVEEAWPALRVIDPKVVSGMPTIAGRTLEKYALTFAAERMSTTAPIVVGTDASRAGFGGTGIAIMGADGHWEQRFVKHTRKILTGELQAILLALHSYQRPISIITDSKFALNCIKDSRQARTIEDKSLAYEINELLAAYNSTVEWHPGHAGHPLNEAAHRLAMGCRRAAQCNQPDEARESIAKEIAAECMAEVKAGVGLAA